MTQPVFQSTLGMECETTKLSDESEKRTLTSQKEIKMEEIVQLR